MNSFLKNKNKGFTLIELLVVVAIISLLSSIIFSSLSSARAKAGDAQRKIEFNQLSKAMALYFDKYGHYPYNMSGTVSPYLDNFNNMADILVAEGFLSKRPVSPCGTTCGYSLGGYAYFNYLGGPIDQAFLITYLQSTPYVPSCKQSSGSSNFCYITNSDKVYCACFPNK